MRITPSIQNRNFLENINQLKGRVDKAQEELSSGKVVNRLSDNPFAAAQASEIGALISTNEQFIAGNAQLRHKLELNDTVLQSLILTADVAKSLAAQALSGTTTPESRQALATAVEGVRQQIISAGNTQFNGISLFSGALTQTQALDDSGGVVTYQGNDEALYERVDRSSVIQTNITGQDLFFDSPSVFALLDNLKTAILADDNTAIHAAMDGLEVFSNRLNTTAAGVGNKLQLLDQLQGSMEDQNRSLGERVSTLTDANVVKSISDLNLASQAVNLTLSAQAKVQQQSLLDFLT